MVEAALEKAQLIVVSRGSAHGEITVLGRGHAGTSGPDPANQARGDWHHEPSGQEQDQGIHEQLRVHHAVLPDECMRQSRTQVASDRKDRGKTSQPASLIERVRDDRQVVEHAQRAMVEHENGDANEHHIEGGEHVRGPPTWLGLLRPMVRQGFIDAQGGQNDDRVNDPPVLDHSCDTGNKKEETNERDRPSAAAGPRPDRYKIFFPLFLLRRQAC